MRTLIPTLVFFMLASNGYGQIERDKALHFLGGGLFGLAGAGIAKNISEGNRVWTFVGAVASSTLIGVAKEAVDSGQDGNGWDNDDLAATILGGVTVGITIDLVSKKRDKRRLRGSYAAVELEKTSFQGFKKKSRTLALQSMPLSINSLVLSPDFLESKVSY